MGEQCKVANLIGLTISVYSLMRALMQAHQRMRNHVLHEEKLEPLSKLRKSAINIKKPRSLLQLMSETEPDF